VPLGSETHGGEDVPVYATGPRRRAATGVQEQNLLFHVMLAGHDLGAGGGASAASLDADGAAPRGGILRPRALNMIVSVCRSARFLQEGSYRRMNRAAAAPGLLQR
jgi:hypothetical protein